MTDAAPAGYDCLTCGACCASESPGEAYVRLTDADLVRLRDTSLPILRYEEQDSDPVEFSHSLGTKFDPNGRRACVGLTGCAGGKNACSVYEQRPAACRRFEVGGYFCRQARQRFG